MYSVLYILYIHIVLVRYCNHLKGDLDLILTVVWFTYSSFWLWNVKNKSL